MSKLGILEFFALSGSFSNKKSPRTQTEKYRGVLRVWHLAPLSKHLVTLVWAKDFAVKKLQ
jgi:hypothetical protein